MSVLSGYSKYKRYILTSSGYKLCSHWTSSNTVHFDDGKTAQTKVGAINGITDSLTSTSSNVALSSKAGKSLQDQVTQLNTGISSVEVYKYNTSTAMGTNPAYVSNDFEAKNTATAMLKPVSSGVLILKPGIYIVIARFIISSTSSGSRVGYGIREFKSASDYMDSMDNTSSASSRTDIYIYIRITKSYDANTYLRPIASAASGGTCTGCSLTVLSLKAG